MFDLCKKAAQDGEVVRHALSHIRVEKHLFDERKDEFGESGSYLRIKSFILDLIQAGVLELDLDELDSLKICLVSDEIADKVVFIIDHKISCPLCGFNPQTKKAEKLKEKMHTEGLEGSPEELVDLGLRVALLSALGIINFEE